MISTPFANVILCALFIIFLYGLISSSVKDYRRSLRNRALLESIVKPARWRHKKRGTTYTMIGDAEAQASTGAINDGDIVVVYRGDDGKLWIRRKSEFMDGRFEEIIDGR